jgi:hypothetical protein
MVLCEWDAPEGDTGQSCVHLFARILSTSFSSVSIFSVCFYSRVSFSMVYTVTPSLVLPIWPYLCMYMERENQCRNYHICTGKWEQARPEVFLPCTPHPYFLPEILFSISSFVSLYCIHIFPFPAASSLPATHAMHALFLLPFPSPSFHVSSHFSLFLFLCPPSISLFPDT